MKSLFICLVFFFIHINSVTTIKKIENNLKYKNFKVGKRYYESVKEYQIVHPVNQIKSLDKTIKNTEIPNFFFPNHDFMQKMIDKTKDYLLTHHKSRCKKL